MDFEAFLSDLGLQTNHHLLVHSAYRKIRTAFTVLSIENLIQQLQQRIGPNGSLMMPAFTYCFKKSTGEYDIFDREKSPSKVGAVSEVFRTTPGVVRTSSPTHSFCLWGRVVQDILPSNAPESPLGKGSVLEWLARQPDAYILLLGVNFSAMSFCHFLEVEAPVPWADFSPWDDLKVEKIGVSIQGEQRLKEVPGCSKSFVNFERYLLEQKIIQPFEANGLKSYYLPIGLIYDMGLRYFRTQFLNLLGPAGSCPACDARWHFYLENKP